MSKLKQLSTLKTVIQDAQKNGKTVVFTNGCYDILHVGHIRCLREAKSIGDILVVAVNSDQSMMNYKGRDSLYYPQEERLEILEAIEYIDYLYLFDELTVDQVLLELKPDIHAKGTDYTVETVPERATVLSYGGRIAIVGDEKNHSSSQIKQKIRKL
ncbi:MAG: adenylyltransferase/cytidyltransferase family protein [Candidatus Auribacterota bacterium]